MANRKKKQSIADQINETLKPKQLTEENDEIEAKFEEFDENVETFNGASNIRKQQAKELSELDSKYEGKAVSRKELESDEESFESDGDEEESFEESENEEESESSQDENEDDFDDIDLSQFNNKKSEDPKLIKETSEEIQKGACVQNQLKIWEKLLEVRIKAQKMQISANGLPNFDAYLALSEQEEGLQFLEKYESTCDNVYGLLDNLLELQTTLCQKFPESKNLPVKRKSSSDGNSSLIKRSKLAEYSDVIEENYDAYKAFSIPVLQKWHERTKSHRDSKNTSMTIMNKIESALLGKKEMIRKSKMYRGDYEIFGTERNEETEMAEIFDDSDFYHQLLRELIEYKSNVGDNQSEITQKFIELQKVRSKMKKKVETRASKGRKIRYNVHNKLVSFMPPKDTSEWTDEAKNELFNSLFGSVKQQ
jgi:protein AATF/BFR2